MAVSLEREITPTSFGEVGRPYFMRRRDDHQLVALCSSFDPLYWPGRSNNEGRALWNRLSLYHGDFERRVAVFDAAKFPINDVAFHPFEPSLLIGTGRYDGGYQFEGELFLWNWETDERRSLLAESREVVACRFVGPGRVAVLLRPRYEGEYGEDDAFTTFVGVVLDDISLARELGLRSGERDPRLIGLMPIDPVNLGFSVPTTYEASLSPADRQHLANLGYEERHRVWDVAWLDSVRVAAVHEGCHVEVWRLPNQREIDLRGDGHGVQLLRQRDRLLVHVLRRGSPLSGEPDRSRLVVLRGESLVEWRQFEEACAFSVDRQGRVLARDTGVLTRSRARRDRLLDSSGGVLFETDLGKYDSLNHYVRLDGGDELYFLRGTPPSSHQAKRLCGVDPAGAVHERMTWDDQGEHLMSGCAIWGPKGSIFRGYRVYNPNLRESKVAVELYSLTKKRAQWRCGVDADVTSMVATTSCRYVVFGLMNGRFGIIDAYDGKLVHDEMLAVEGVPTVATALAVQGRMLLVGTIDGRLLLYSLGEA